jgi:hypothetical protein
MFKRFGTLAVLFVLCILFGSPAWATTSAPTFSTGTGTYYAPISVSISDATSGSVIYYTTDGTTPGSASARYSGPVPLASTATLKAIAIAAGVSSAVSSATYTISAPLTPSFSTGTGTYYAPLSVTINEGTKCAAVYYSTDGSTPTSNSRIYSGPIAIGVTTKLQTIAQCQGGAPSPIAAAIYTISAPVAPSFSTGTGTYYSPVSISITEATNCAAVYYTVDGSTPTASSMLYNGPVTLGSTATLKAIAQCSGGAASAVDSATYTISLPSPPSFSTGTGTYYAPVKVSLSDATRCASIFYTTDGTRPTTASTVYTTTLTISSTTKLQAIAACSGGGTSSAASSTYTIVPAATPIFNMASGTYNRSVSVTITDATPGAVIYYTADGTTPTTSSLVYKAPVLLSSTATFSSAIQLKAIAVYPGGIPSAVKSATYTVLSTTVPVHSQNSSAAFFGMDVNALLNGTPWPAVPFGTLRLWDSQTRWSTLNPKPGTYVWTSLDKQIELAQSHNTQILFTFGGTPAWAIPGNIPISQISRSAGVVTVNTATAHGIYYNRTYPAASQSSITISGVSDTDFNGTFLLTGSPSATTLTFAQAGSDAVSSSGFVNAVCGGAYAPGGCAEAPATLTAWDQFVTALIGHVGPGAIRYWELWNEANHGSMWLGDPKLLVTMAAHARSIIKAVDPDAIILSPSTVFNYETAQQCATVDARCGSTWLSNWLGAGGSSTIDGVSFHAYPVIGENPEQVQGAIAQLQSVMNQSGIGLLPLWDTESGWGQSVALPGLSDQAAFAARHLMLIHSLGVQGVAWYAYDNPNWGTLWSASAGENEVADAYRQVTRWLEGAAVTQPCAPTASDPATFTCGYSRPNGYSALAIWNTTGAATFTAPQGYVQYRDLAGNLIPIAQSSVQITSAPILLENASAF